MLEKIRQTDQKTGISSPELKTVLGVVESLTATIEPVVHIVSQPEIKNTTGWEAGFRGETKGGEQYRWLKAGSLHAGVLRCPRGERMDFQREYSQTSKGKCPNSFSVSFTDTNGESCYLVLNMEDRKILSLKMGIDIDNLCYFLDIDSEKRRMTVTHREIKGMALFFEGLGNGTRGEINLAKATGIQVGENSFVPDPEAGTLEEPMDAVKWYIDQGYVKAAKVSDVASWIETLLLSRISLRQILLTIESRAEQTLQVISSVASSAAADPSLGTAWTKEEEATYLKKLRNPKTPTKRKPIAE